MIFVLIFTVWLILNAKLTMEICVIGVLMSAAVSLFYYKFIPRVEEKKPFSLRRIFLYFYYILILIVEILKADINIIRMAFAKKLTFEPKLVYFRTDLREVSSRVLLANSITLTPGTITVSLEGNLFCVHCLDRSLGDGIDESVFVEILRKIEEV